MTDTNYDSTAYPVFRGLGRKPTFMGVPTNLGLGAFMSVAVIATLFGLAFWGLLLIVMPIIAVITREDDKAFDVIWLEMKTRKTNRNKSFWGGSSYAINSYPKDRPWLNLISTKEIANG